MSNATDLTPPEDGTTSDRRRRRRLPWIVAGGAALVVLVAFVLVYFQPQKLFLDDEVNEDLAGFVVTEPAPAATAPSEAAMTDAPATAAPTDPVAAAGAEAARTGAPVAVSAGAFASLDHPTSGGAYLVVQPDGSRLLRIEDLDTDNGPDLRVVLSTSAVGTGDYGDLLELGALKGNIGDQNYEIPPEVDLTTIRSVVIWCERFSAPFGEAPTVVDT